MTVNKIRGGRVRQAVKADLPFIHEWLKLEERHGLGFINNWGMIQTACAKKRMSVFTSPEGPIGFLTDGISYNTILQTRSDYQGRGVGRALVEHAIRKEEAMNNAVLIVECAPRSSIEFWARMGFEAHRNAEDIKLREPIYMQRLSKLAHPHVRGDDLEMVTVSVYPEYVQYSKEPVKPDRVHYVLARIDLQTQTLQLARRISVAHEPMLKDPVVDISWSHLEIYRGKAKRAEAAAIGLTRTPNECGWYLDEIKLNDVASKW